jgi:hypothetical protein
MTRAREGKCRRQSGSNPRLGGEHQIGDRFQVREKMRVLPARPHRELKNVKGLTQRKNRGKTCLRLCCHEIFLMAGVENRQVGSCVEPFSQSRVKLPKP